MDENLNIQDLINFIAHKHGMSKKNAENFVREFFSLITNSLEQDGNVRVKGLGSFKLTEKPVDESATGELFDTFGGRQISFTPDPSLKPLINRANPAPKAIFFDEAEEIAIGEMEVPAQPEAPAAPAAAEGVVEQPQPAEPVTEAQPEPQPAEPVTEAQPEEAAPVAEETEVPVPEEAVAPVTEAVEEVVDEAKEEVADVLPEAAEPVGEPEVPETPADEPVIETVPVEPAAPVVDETADDDLWNDPLLDEPLLDEKEEPEPQAAEPQTHVGEVGPVAALKDGQQQPKGYDYSDIYNGKPLDDGFKDIGGRKGDKNKLLYLGLGLLALCLLGLCCWLLFGGKGKSDTTVKQAPAKPAVTTVAKDSTFKDTVSAPVAAKEIVVPAAGDAASKEVQPQQLDKSKKYKAVGTLAQHESQPGETLMKISAKYYGTSHLWRYIADYNKDVLPNPDKFSDGIVLKIPKLEEVK